MKQIFVSCRSISSKLVNLINKMPKDTPEHIEKSQKQRIKIREKSQFYSPGTVNLQVLGSGARGTSSSIYLFSEQSRYLFNCGEGTQRLAHEHRTKLTRMDHIFLTRNTWNRFGGVPGLCLTLQEIGVPKLNLHGLPGIENIFESTRRFVVLRNMKVETPVCEQGGFFEDSVLRVNYVPLCKDSGETSKAAAEAVENPVEVKNDWDAETSEKTSTSEAFKDDTDYFGYENKNSRDGKSTLEKLNETRKTDYNEGNDQVMAYICKLRERAGTLDFSKCVERGVKPGPLLGRLKNGFDVTLPDGTIVKADDVRGAASPGSVFVFVDIPDEGYLKSLTSSEAFKPFQKGAQSEDDVALIVVHFSPEEMMENAIYKEWINDFSPSTKHWFINERNEFTGYFASHRIQHQLNELHSQVFPMLKERHPYLPEKNESCPEADGENPAKKLKIDTETGTVDKFSEYPEVGILSCFHIRPNKGFDRLMEPISQPDKSAEHTVAEPEVKILIDAFKESAKKYTIPRSSAVRAKEFPKIITFGTGSCIPNKTRNVSANLVHFSENNCAILDCGEGTLGQLIRFYGRDGADEVLKKTKMIYVSHLHADHHLGLINILNRRRKLTNEKVLLLAPSQMRAWLAFYNYQNEEIFSTFDLFPCSDLLGWNVEKDVKESLFKRLNLVNIETCYVKHCPHSFGISIEMVNTMKSMRFPSETIKITYSGDTLPCESLVALGQNSDVLIHEATMEDDLEKEARIKMHSTVSQAIDVGRQMKAKFVILTHFSQRYAKIPIIKQHVENVVVGFDNMEVTLNDLPMAHLMYEPLKMMFSDHFELLEQKALKRKHQQERKIEINLENGNTHNKVKKFASSDED